MSTLFSLLLLLAVVALFLGMLSPRLVLVWGESKTRLRVIKVYGLLLILSAILISVTSSPKVEEEGAYVTAAVLNVRQEPSTSSQIVGKLARGTSVDIFRKDGDWLQIKHKGDSVWVHADFVGSRSEVETAEKESRAKADQLASASVGRTSSLHKRAKSVTLEWYAGGDLHKKAFRDWNAAPHRNRLATCADFVAVMGKFKSVEAMKPRAVELEVCISEAASAAPDHMQVGEIAAACGILLGYK